MSDIDDKFNEILASGIKIDTEGLVKSISESTLKMQVDFVKLMDPFNKAMANLGHSLSRASEAIAAMTSGMSLLTERYINGDYSPQSKEEEEILRYLIVHVMES